MRSVETIEASYIAHIPAALFAKVVSELPQPSVNNQTTELHAGFLLGIQFAIQAFKEHVK